MSINRTLAYLALGHNVNGNILEALSTHFPVKDALLQDILKALTPFITSNEDSTNPDLAPHQIIHARTSTNNFVVKIYQPGYIFQILDLGGLPMGYYSWFETPIISITAFGSTSSRAVSIGEFIDTVHDDLSYIK